MEALLQSLATKYGFDYAAKLLGLDQQSQNPKYTFGMPFTNNKVGINPMRMIANQGIKSLMGGGKMGGMLSVAAPLALGAGAIYLLNKNREKLTGYKTQQAYEDARNQRRADSRLDKITNRIVAGKNYGNYERALLDSGAGAINVNDKIMYSSDYFPQPGYKNFDDKFESIEDIVVNKPKKTYTPPVNIAQISGGGGGQRDSGSTPSPSKSSSGSSSSYSSSRGSNFGSRFHARRGGIASL